MSDIARNQASSQEPAKAEAYTTADWLQALDPSVITPTAWHMATEGKAGKRSAATVNFIDAEGRDVLTIERSLISNDGRPDMNGKRVINGRDITELVADPSTGEPVYFWLEPPSSRLS